MRRLILCFLVLIFSFACIAETIEARSPTLTLTVDPYKLHGTLDNTRVYLEEVSPQVQHIVWTVIGDETANWTSGPQSYFYITDSELFEVLNSGTRITVRATIYTKDGGIAVSNDVHFNFEDYGQGGEEECMLCYCYNTRTATAYAVVYYWDYTNGSEMKYFLIANPYGLEDVKDSDWIVGYKGDDTYMLAFYEAKLSFDEETEAYWIDVQEPLDDRLFEVDTTAQSVQEVLLNCAGFDTDTDKLIHVENLIATQNGYEVFDDDYHIYTYFN